MDGIQSNTQEEVRLQLWINAVVTDWFLFSSLNLNWVSHDYHLSVWEEKANEVKLIYPHFFNVALLETLDVGAMFWSAHHGVPQKSTGPLAHACHTGTHLWPERWQEAISSKKRVIRNPAGLVSRIPFKSLGRKLPLDDKIQPTSISAARVCYLRVGTHAGSICWWYPRPAPPDSCLKGQRQSYPFH